MASIKDQIAAWTFNEWGKGGASWAPNHKDDSSNALPLSKTGAIVANGAGLLTTQSTAYFRLKTELHQKLLSQIDLVALEKMPKDAIKKQLAQMVSSLIDDFLLPVNEQERDSLITDLLNEITGLGPLEPLLADSSISEIMVNGFDTIFVERKGKLELSCVRFTDDAALLKVIDKIVSYVGRRIDESSPMVDARLKDGSRINAIIPPIALDGPTLTIRRFAAIPLKMEDLISKHALTMGMAEMLSAMVKAKLNILISGGTGSGKTTLLNILSSYIPDGERIITIEDTAELQLQQNHVIRLETRPPNIEGSGEISMRALVKNSLRMRPDRIILGEVRGSEVIDMLQAMNTGHDGSLTTVHANTPRDALARIENLIGLGGANVPAKAIRQQISAAIHLVVQASRLNDGSRKVVSIHEITGMEGDVITTQEIFYYERLGTNPDGSTQGRFRSTGLRPKWSEKIKSYGISLREDLFDPEKKDH